MVIEKDIGFIRKACKGKGRVYCIALSIRPVLAESMMMMSTIRLVLRSFWRKQNSLALEELYWNSPIV
jgi:hypothetical protein